MGARKTTKVIKVETITYSRATIEQLRNQFRTVPNVHTPKLQLKAQTDKR